MKTLRYVLACLLLSTPVCAQETLISGDVDFGGYGGPFLQLTSINEQFGVLVGGGGGVIIDHTISIGGAGYGLANDVTEENAPASRPYLDVGYGGVFIQYIHRSDDLIHFTGGFLIGGGGVGYRRSTSVDGSDVGSQMNDAFFVLEPGVESVLNVTRYFRVAVGGGYRYVAGIETPGLSNSDIAGPVLKVMFNFGSF